MRFGCDLVPGRLRRRYKRFFAEVELADGRLVTAHCPNPGSMLSVDVAGSEVWLSPCDNPKRTLPYTWELIRIGGGLVGINTGRPNRLAEEAILAGKIPELAGYATLRREVRYGESSRIDLLLTGPDRSPCLVEIKNVTLKRDADGPGPVEFPDSVTQRGSKHLDELARAVGAGSRAVMLYVTQRSDARRLAFAADIDAEYSRRLRNATRAGVEALCYRCAVDTDGIRLSDPIPVELPQARPA